MFSHIKPQLIMLQLCTVCQNNPLNLANILQVKNNTNNIKYSLYEGKYSGRKHMAHPVVTCTYNFFPNFRPLQSHSAAVIYQAHWDHFF